MAEWTRETPWRQGHLLTREAIETFALLHPEHPGDGVVIVATHNCDLVQSLETEPSVELIIGRKIAELDGNYTHAKSARTLHIKFDSATPLFAEFITTAKLSVSKTDLADFEPEPNFLLSPEGQAAFQRWLAARYRRSAFPDEFERRLQITRLTDRLSKAVKPHGEKIVAVVFDVDEGEEKTRDGVDDVYTLGISLIHATEPDYESAEAAAKTAKEAIKKAFEEKLFDKNSGKWKYIELSYIDVLSEDALTYHQFTLMKPWRLDYVSLGAEPQQPIVPE
jgi:hypothetical protein